MGKAYIKSFEIKKGQKMIKTKLKQYEIFKIETTRFVEKKGGSKYSIKPVFLSKREAIEKGELVKIQSNQLTEKIKDYFRTNNLKMPDMLELIVNIVVPGEAKKAGEKQYSELAKNGFELNGEKYVRLYSGSGQIRRNTITFIRSDLYAPIFNSLLCGLTLEDFGKEFNAAKFNAYCGLNMSGCHLLPEELTPNVCIIDDFEQVRPHNTVNYVTEEAVQYITLPNEDYILTSSQTEYEINGEKAIRKSDGIEFTIHTGIKKNVKSLPYNEIEDSPALNSFDGQGIMSVEWADKISMYLGWEYTPSELIVRAPWVKGLLVTMDFKEWFAEQGITEITDSFGKKRNIDSLDCLISKSQFKMHKIYNTKCLALGWNAWDYHKEQMSLNHLKWGVVKANKPDDATKELNYQYLQALQLDTNAIEELCAATDDYLTRLNSGSIEDIYNNLVINSNGLETGESEDCDYKALFQKVIEANPKLVNDRYIRGLILKECAAKFQGAKIGKIIVRGNYQFCVADPIAQLEWIAKKHGGSNIEIKGVVPAGFVYSNYWMYAEDSTKEITLLRSPLIDRNEIAKRTLINEPNHYLQYLNSGIVYSIHDLTPLQQGGCDFDGDIIFSTNSEIIANGSIDFEEAKPLYYKLKSTDLVGAITQHNIIEADIRGLNSAVGSISNKGASLYAMMAKYNAGSAEYEKIYKSIIALGQIVGMEIDRIKTAVSPTFPLEWQSIQAERGQDRNFEDIPTVTEIEQKGIYHHNDTVPNIKPYYFRYCYDYLNNSIAQIDKCFNLITVRKYKLKLSEFIAKCQAKEATDEMYSLYNQYLRAYPVIDTDCIVNHICHHFEQFEKQIRKQVHDEGVNMLNQFASQQKIDVALLAQVRDLIIGYQRHKRLIAQSFNANHTENAKNKFKSIGELMSCVKNYYKNSLYEITGGDLQTAFDCLLQVTDEKNVWEILDSDIVHIVKER